MRVSESPCSASHLMSGLRHLNAWVSFFSRVYPFSGWAEKTCVPWDGQLKWKSEHLTQVSSKKASCSRHPHLLSDKSPQRTDSFFLATIGHFATWVTRRKERTSGDSRSEYWPHHSIWVPFLVTGMLVNNASPTWIRSFVETLVVNSFLGWCDVARIGKWLVGFPPNGMLVRMTLDCSSLCLSQAREELLTCA